MRVTESLTASDGAWSAGGVRVVEQLLLDRCGSVFKHNGYRRRFWGSWQLDRRIGEEENGGDWRKAAPIFGVSSSK